MWWCAVCSRQQAGPSVDLLASRGRWIPQVASCHKTGTAVDLLAADGEGLLEPPLIILDEKETSMILFPPLNRQPSCRILRKQGLMAYLLLIHNAAAKPWQSMISWSGRMRPGWSLHSILAWWEPNYSASFQFSILTTSCFLFFLISMYCSSSSYCLPACSSAVCSQ